LAKAIHTVYGFPGLKSGAIDKIFVVGQATNNGIGKSDAK